MDKVELVKDFKCPDCMAPMAWRKNRTNHTRFMGCTEYPTCNGSRDEHGVASRVANGRRETKLVRLLKAAVLRSEDECLTFTDEEMTTVDLYDLHLNPVPDERGYVLTVEKKV